MAFLYMGFACEDDLEKSKRITPFRDGVIVMSENETGIHDSEFGPIEHPVEPLDEDQPVKCPVLNSAVLNNGSKPDEQIPENLQKRAEQQSRQEQRVIVPATEAPAQRTLRKRHHTQTSFEDYSSSPFLRMPPRDLTFFDVLQQVDKA
ncbi:hypothetical protein ACET3Z_024616 [Daucus carota]